MTDRSDFRLAKPLSVSAAGANLFAGSVLPEPRDNSPIEVLIKRRVTLGFTVAVLMTSLMGFLAWHSTRQAAKDSDWVTHTYVVMGTLESTVRQVIEAETSARMFARTGEDSLLAHYATAKGSIARNEDSLRQLTADNPNQQKRLAVLDLQISAALKFADKMIAQYRQTQTMPGTSDILETENLMNAVRTTIQDIQTEETELLSQRTEKASTERRLTGLITVVGTLVGIGFMVLAAFAIRREVGITATAREQLSVLNADLELRVAERTTALQSSVVASERASKELADQKFALDQHAIVAVTDVQGTITYVNEKFCVISKYSKAELIGQNHRILNSGHHSKEFFQQMYHTIAQGKVWHGEIKNRSKDGSIYWVDTTVVPFIGKDGKPRQYVAIRADITERKRAEEIRERLAAVVDSSDDAIIAKTLDGTITAWNRGAEKLFGYPSSEAVGMPMQKLIPDERADEESGILACVRRGESVDHFETIRVRKDGEKIDISATISPIRDGSGTVVGASQIARDITDRKRAEEALKRSLAASEQALKELADQKFALDQHAIVAVTDVQGTITYVNEKFCVISQYSKEELIGQNHRILNSGHHSKEFFQQMYHTIAQGKVWHGEIKNRSKDGSIYWVDTTVVPFIGKDGKPRQYVAIRADITARKRAEEIRERLAAVVDSSDDAIIAKTLDGTITAWNRGAEKLFGYSSSEAVGKSMLMLLPRERANEESDILASVRRGESVDHFETIRVRKDGEKIDISATISPIRDGSGTVVGASQIARDITDRKRAEEALKRSLAASEQALKELADQKFALDQHAIVAVTDVQGTITYVNEKFCVISQYSKEELIGQNHRILNSTHHPKEFFQDMYHTIANGKVWHGEIKNRAKDGSIYWVDTTIVPTLSAEGKPRQYVAIRADITERKQAEQALRAQTRMFQSVLDSMDEGLITADEHGQFLQWNPAAEKILGKGATNLPAQEWTDHYGCYLPDGVTPFPTDQLPLVRAIRGEAADVEMLVRNPHFTDMVWIEVSARPLKDDDGIPRGGVVAFRDVTQSKAAQQKIRQLNDDLEARVIERTAQLQEANQELEAFTYSVSHDLRAPLRHMAGFSGMLMEEFGPALDSQAQHYVQRIQEGTRKMGQLVDELLGLARVGRQSPSLQVAGLDSIVAEVVAMLKPEYDGREVEWKIASLPFVDCDPGLMKQVFQNLLSNSLKYSLPRNPAVIEVGTIQSNGQPVIFVRDNGVGFSMKYSDKLFGVFQRLHRSEDFEGTGVGLATVQRIIKKHGGRVWAEAELDKGATFYFTVGVAAPAECKSISVTTGA